MSNVTPSAATLALLAMLLPASSLQAADLPYSGGAFEAAPALTAGGGGYWVPRIPLRPAPTRFDIYGYPILGPGLLGRPAPHAIGVGCPPVLEPAYDPDGNLAGYAPLQYCR